MHGRAFAAPVAAQALIRAGRDDLPADEAIWRHLPIALTPDQPDGGAWAPVVDDWSKPPPLQPPAVADADRAACKRRRSTRS